jgi:hypothetical protein
MSLIETLLSINEANRLYELEKRSTGMLITGDFDSSVTGSWVTLAQTGAGIVRYKNKEYITKPLGFTSIQAGKEVEMSYANGIYYSKW